MDRDTLMQLAAEKAVDELSWESIEFLFRPTNQFELLLRLDFDGMRHRVNLWWTDESPDAMPFRFRGEAGAPMERAIKTEEFYRRMKAIRHENRTQPASV